MPPPDQTFHERPPIALGPMIENIREADAALAAKQGEPSVAALLGGPPAADDALAGGAWRRRFPGADLYWGHDVGAHEVHGDIRAKYDVLGGPTGLLGLPVTDETGTPDGVGRFNHFQGGSIYWTPRTGPFLVHGGVRDTWAGLGWERGWLGYPVADQKTLTGLSPGDHPTVGWTLFENGAVVQTKDGHAPAVHADITPEDLKAVVRRFVDDGVRASPDNVGLHPQSEIVGVSDWSWDFRSSTPRAVTYAVHGFHDNGLWADTDFKILLTLSFGLVWADSTVEPGTKTVVARLRDVQVVGENNAALGGGVAEGPVVRGVRDAIRGRFFRGGPDPAAPEVPDGAVRLTDFRTGVKQTGDGDTDVIDLQVTAQGGLQVLLNPLPLWPPVDAGLLRRLVAQNTLDAFVNP
ncbi:LGFP repeat-containing protein [Phycicoccus avicenniae]|uniref:LGFP repeat-containing protein n=1 Tax=Phycicoccus avicenniae TaxID=2828860 RepID=UPI003D2CABF0